MKYLKTFEHNSDYENYINGGGEVFLPNVSYVAENNRVYCNPIVPNYYFSGIINALRTTVKYQLFEGNIVGMDNIKTMKINDAEVTPISASTFSTTGNNSYFVELKQPLTSANELFINCYQLTSLDLSNFDTSNVTGMSDMFSDCRGLISLNLSNFNTSNVTSMRNMFSRCSKLTSLDVSNWDTSKVTDMSGMYLECSGLTNLDVSNWDTSKVTDMRWMFNGCKGLTSLDVSNFDTSKVTDMNTMFNGCERLTSLDVSNFNTSNVTSMSLMFGFCTGLTSLDLSNFNTSKVTDMSYIFNNCCSLTEVRMGGNPSNISDVSNMFYRITTTGKFYYNSAYDYSKIIAQLPSTWTSVACTLTDGVLIPN